MITRQTTRLMAVLVIAGMLAVSAGPMIQQLDPGFLGIDEADGATGYWTYTVTLDGKVTGSGSAIANPGAAGAEGTIGRYVSSDGSNVGSWGFDYKGFGPFGSFYAAFDACHGNKIICHLDPDDLTKDVYGTSLSEYGVHTLNIMWVLPTVYWKVDGSGNLILSNDPSKGTAYAHTLDGDVHEYIGIGVYEASTATIGGKVVLTSTTDSKPIYNQARSTLRTYANNNTVATQDGSTVTGHAMLWNYYAWQLYRFSVLTVGGGWNSQGIFGNGDVYGGHYGSSVGSTGVLDKSGPYAGTVADPNGAGDDGYHSDSVKVFIENAWGSLSEHVDGVLIFKSGSNDYLATNMSAKPSDSYYSGYSTIGVMPLSFTWTTTHASSSTNPGFWGMPTPTGGSQTAELYDNCRSNTKTSASRPCGLFVGGSSTTSATGSAQAGLSNMDAFCYVWYTNSEIGGRLAFVFDSDPTVIPTVTYDHSSINALLSEFGYPQSLIDGLKTESTSLVQYDTLGTVAEFKHVGWIIDGVQYPANSAFIKKTDHIARSVWVGTPAVTYDHSRLIEATGDSGSVAGLENAIEVKGHYNYVQLPARDGYAHVGWLIEETGQEVGPTDEFVMRQSHTAISMWSEIPMVILDHTNLTDIVGTIAEGVSDLQTSMMIEGNTSYPKLPNTAGYRHIGWEIGETTVGPTAELESQKTHYAKSLWEKIPDVLPIFPDDNPWADDDPVVILPEDEKESWLGKNGKTVVIAAIVAVIIGELAVLAFSRRL